MSDSYYKNFEFHNGDGVPHATSNNFKIMCKVFYNDNHDVHNTHSLIKELKSE